MPHAGHPPPGKEVWGVEGVLEDALGEKAGRKKAKVLGQFGGSFLWGAEELNALLPRTQTAAGSPPTD